MNRDGKTLVSAAGAPETQAQPPCLLRYSPQLWAKELPTMFVHDPETNKLSLQPGRHPPWIRKTSFQIMDGGGGHRERSQKCRRMPSTVDLDLPLGLGLGLPLDFPWIPRIP